MDGFQSRDSFVLGYPHGTGTKVEVGGWVLVHIRGAQTTHTGSPSSERKMRFQIRSGISPCAQSWESPCGWSGHPVCASKLIPRLLLWSRYHGNTLGHSYHASGDQPSDIAKIIVLSSEIDQ